MDGMVKVVFRVDASVQIGTGHVMRCLTLANALRENGAECVFIGREHPGDLLDMLEENSFGVLRIPKAPEKPDTEEVTTDYSNWLGVTSEQDANDCLAIIKGVKPDWLVVDHYALDADWEKIFKPYVGRIMVIDDLANRTHCCDVLLDQNLGHWSRDYTNIVPADSKVLIGPEYALLRSEFSIHREGSLARRNEPVLEHILITMGGVDADNATGRMLGVLANASLPGICHITVVMGSRAIWLKEVKELAASMPFQTRVVSGVSNMAEIMAKADLAIGAGGSTSWERCCLGLPSLIVVLAENQRLIAEELENAGGAHALSLVDIEKDLPDIVTELLNQPGKLNAMSRAAAAITDGSGAERVARLLQ